MNYSIENYERPSVAADIVFFGISTVDGDTKRQGKLKKLRLLLIRRGEEPFEGQLALPGGFLRRGETIEQTAVRELKEETGIDCVKLINSGIYTAPDRDPRGWIISSAFLALSNTTSLQTAESSDASQAYWFDFSYSENGRESEITLVHEDTALKISYTDGKAEKSPLAFDHAQIILDCFMRLRDEVLHHNIIFDLLPEMFPVSELQQIYESITGTKEASANFRRKMKDKIEETEFYGEITAHRPSKLYRRITQ